MNTEHSDNGIAPPAPPLSIKALFTQSQVEAILADYIKNNYKDFKVVGVEINVSEKRDMRGEISGYRLASVEATLATK